MAQKLVGSYLKDRNQCVIEENDSGLRVMSDFKIIKKGVPQGSILGPLLYIIYTNELPKLVTDHMVLYADVHRNEGGSRY